MFMFSLKAGIPDTNLFIALEPEAASIYCQYLPTEKLRGAEADFQMSTAGTRYMIVDLGGKFLDKIYTITGALDGLSYPAIHVAHVL